MSMNTNKSIMCVHVASSPDSPDFSMLHTFFCMRATLKNREWPGDEAMYMYVADVDFNLAT